MDAYLKRFYLSGNDELACLFVREADSYGESAFKKNRNCKGFSLKYSIIIISGTN
jgi:hypothetical protein